ncbi:MAG TPA: NapC/NirT family cytochrome c [Polyangiales bacterium]|nr:NapC/NirT family cytochrome c [Polyangiales bacterium]
MDPSAPATQFAPEAVIGMHPVMVSLSIGCAVLAAIILVWFLARKPALTGGVKFVLLLGIGVLPIGSAATGNIAGFEHTKHRSFCGSCHVMGPYREDSESLASHSLASMHARNEEFGADNCYECHKDYGAFSTMMTKLGGMLHVYHYYTHYSSVDVKTALAEIQLYKPFSNSNCMRCHSTQARDWLSVADHEATLPRLRNGEVSCASAGCHGPVHPFSKPKANTQRAQR